MLSCVLLSVSYFFSHDFLQIYDGADVIAVETGKITKSVIRSSQSHMKLYFHSDRIGTRKGFHVKVQFFLDGKYDLGLCFILQNKYRAHITINCILIN